MIILGIDPGLAITGYGIINEDKKLEIKLITYGCINTNSKLSTIERLEKIHLELKKIVKKYKPDKIAVEELFFAKNVKTALKVGEARGVILLTIRQKKVPFFEFTPLQVKQAVASYGRASKQQVQKMVKAILNLEKVPKSDDAADALAIAITCAQTKVRF
ncbi:crossover junction endodeoxyribonuclease RuvC [Candidatus Kuenenbacteria bacterium HGW-Kuenenbacteria-1]|uniref:Crossover junction endodeoxyribonuclease RuvC n=1 Tax=Candidatus Kuenenbacteria bacterium HGW-Kuenenbacteria-1 TaxID=2013812 RepID=A0A2N1UNL3_9BACT|nr:MAG: crossover junction endodeoxyribonuclease RuvC [Candidatus Kuenenbacteria bacterium HGW-Kuenenbacteria-1]